MNRFSHWVLSGVMTAALPGCGAPPPPPAAAVAPAPAGGAPADQLRRVVEHYWEDDAALSAESSGYGIDIPFGATPAGFIAPQSLADALALERRYLSEVSKIPPEKLDPESRLTYDIFRRERVLAVEGFTYPFELMPVNPDDAMPQEFARLACAAERLALSNRKDFDDWMARTESFARWTTQAIANMRDGMRRGYTLPRPVVQGSLRQLAILAEDTASNPFFQALRTNAAGAGHESGADAMAAAVRSKILPAYRALHDFLQYEYLPRARTSVALSALPLGDAWYAYLLKRNTGGLAGAAQLHELGQTEVDHLHQRMQALLTEGSVPGGAQTFIATTRQDPRYSYGTPADLMAAYADLKAQTAKAAPALFPGTPRADFAIRPVEAYREAQAPPLSYEPRAPEAAAPAVLYVDTAALDTRRAIDPAPRFLREAVPGHHYQIEVQRERTDLPRFRRFGSEPAFVAGWGLYAATQGEALGVYTTLEARFGALREQLDCAAAMVIDTGLHAQGWTPQQALDYAHAQAWSDDTEAAAMVDRALALPGTAAACTVGFLKILALRSHAQQSLGARFSARAFHAVVVGEGAMPLDLLDARLQAWIEAGGPGPVEPAEDAAASVADLPSAAEDMASAAKKD